MTDHLNRFIEASLGHSLSQLNAIYEQESILLQIKQESFENLLECINALNHSKSKAKKKKIVKMIAYDGVFLQEALGDIWFNKIALALGVSAEEITQYEKQNSRET